MPRSQERGRREACGREWLEASPHQGRLCSKATGQAQPPRRSAQKRTAERRLPCGAGSRFWAFYFLLNVLLGLL